MDNEKAEVIRVLLFEDDPGDADFLKETLCQERDPSFIVENVPKLKEGLTRLKSDGVNLVLLDLSLPDSQGFDTFAKVYMEASSLPIVVLTGLDDQSMALEAVRCGAQDYLVKGEVSGRLLSRILRYAIERKKIEAERKQIEQMKDDFVNTVSHELRTPLSIVKQGISLLLDQIPGPVNTLQGTILGTTRENIDRLTRIINSLLDVSKLEAGRVVLKRERVDLVKLVAQVGRDFEVLANEKKLKIEVEVPKEPVAVYADPDKVIQVFTNLVGNAIKFTEKGSIRIRVEPEGPDVRCAVSDTGMGISQENLPKVFNRFEQFGRSGRGREAGTGLGLAITKGLVELHGGHIKVESAAGEGTTFTFTLPQEEEIIQHAGA